ncbi:MAG: EAL domain-containing protein [Comamonas sp.]|nr:EAL domain-containing protein [Comamonas sp.]
MEAAMHRLTSPLCESPSEQPAAFAAIRPHFQPIVASRSHALFAVEALLRLPAMTTSCEPLVRQWEASGEVVKIDILMVRRVAAALRRSTFGLPLRVGVNVSALTVALIPDQYLRELEHLTKVASGVIVEVTETYPIHDIGALLYFARKCSALGVRIALDDCKPQHVFSSPWLVSWVRPDIIKIDGALLCQCFEQQSVEPVAEIIRLARSIGAAVVAEHIESKVMGDWACNLGAGFMQGYYFGTPQPLQG